MAAHTASVTVNAPTEEVYRMWSHFNDYPKFMSHIKEVTYYDENRSHWVADIVGHHEWDAINDSWIEQRQIGWRSIDGLENSGTVTFEPHGEGNTLVTVTVEYTPPAGFIGELGEVLGAGKRFETALQEDLNLFATMISQAPTGSLDPMSSDYLFHAGSAAARGKSTQEQDRSVAAPWQAGIMLSKDLEHAGAPVTTEAAPPPPESGTDTPNPS